MINNKIRAYNGDSDNFKNIAIAIKLICKSRQQRHLGIFIKPDDDRPAKLMHLAWHNDFRLDENIDNGYMLIPTFEGCEETLAEIFVDWLLLVWEENKDGFPYSIMFNAEETSFNTGGEVRELSLGEGFTCSTFVLECFRSQGYELIKYDTWPSRSDDENWADTIYSYLDKTKNIQPEHVSVQRECSAITRYRPEEVAAAANLSNFDGVLLSFQDIHQLSCEIVRVVS